MGAEAGQAKAAVRQVVSAPDAPKAMGAYSPAIKAGNLLFISGQIPVDPSTGNLIQGDIAAQAEQVMRNLTALLRAAGHLQAAATAA